MLKIFEVKSCTLLTLVALFSSPRRRCFACWNLTASPGLLINLCLLTRSFNSDRDIKYVVFGVDG
jgi:hypothetical protein